MASGRPTSENTRSRAHLTPAHVGSTIRVAIKYRLAVSVTVNGSQRSPSRVRNQPLKSIAHSPLATSDPDTVSPWATGLPPPRLALNKASALQNIANRRGRRPYHSWPLHYQLGPDLLWTKTRKPPPHREDRSPRLVTGGVRANIWSARNLFIPAIIPAVAAALPDVKRLPRNTVASRHISRRKSPRVKVLKHPDTLFHCRSLPESHRPISLWRLELKLSGMSPV